jgi:hypothetical protein
MGIGDFDCGVRVGTGPMWYGDRPYPEFWYRTALEEREKEQEATVGDIYSDRTIYDVGLDSIGGEL